MGHFTVNRLQRRKVRIKYLYATLSNDHQNPSVGARLQVSSNSVLGGAICRRKRCSMEVQHRVAKPDRIAPTARLKDVRCQNRAVVNPVDVQIVVLRTAPDRKSVV